MEEMHQEKEYGQEAGIWQKKYFDAMAELHTATKEIDMLRDHIERTGQEPPISPTQTLDRNLNDNVSVSSFGTSSRPLSASTSERPNSSSSIRRIANRPTAVPQLNIDKQSPSTITPTSSTSRDLLQSLSKRSATVDPNATRESIPERKLQTSRSVGGNFNLFIIG